MMSIFYKYNFVLFQFTTNVIICYVPCIYKEYLVKIGDPWNVTCYTQYDEPTRWIFTSALPFYNNSLYLNDQLDEIIEDRYNMIVKNRRHSFTLEISKTDKYHAGFYQCTQKNGVTLEESLRYKLTLVGNSTIKLLTTKNKDIKLVINVSYVGFQIPLPFIRCKFSYGDQEMNEKYCKNVEDDLSNCYFEKVYGPDDDPPMVCQIWFVNGERNFWKEEQFSLIEKSDISYVNEGESYHMRCDTTSTASMGWYFTQVSPINKEIVLFDRWTVQSAALNRYNFTYSNDSKTYSMIIAHVDVKHAGSYKCVHKSTRHLIAKKIELVVIEQSSIQFLNINPTTLIMSVSYVGHEAPAPIFQCSFSVDTIKMSDVECHKIVHQATVCRFQKSFDLGKEVPIKCQIWFENHLQNERSFIEGKKMFVPMDLPYHTIVTIVLCTILSVVVFGMILLCRSNSCLKTKINFLLDPGV